MTMAIMMTLTIMMMTNQVRTIFLQWIPWVLRMARPGEKITRKTIMMQVSVTVAIKVQAIIGGSSVIVLTNIDFHLGLHHIRLIACKWF